MIAVHSAFNSTPFSSSATICGATERFNTLMTCTSSSAEVVTTVLGDPHSFTPPVQIAPLVSRASHNASASALSTCRRTALQCTGLRTWACS
ncbi:hypothetical protein PF004_g32771 [Phytophthora fragariae]|uniref:Uncharacterized protein n=1 Tax=Phytophthora fragariae TaxID=53985 RepID=A0A6G0M5Y3_9STRA|nr:hypothetical protein PF004_g32771 [Phytophthora fragariae]